MNSSDDNRSSEAKPINFRACLFLQAALTNLVILNCPNVFNCVALAAEPPAITQINGSKKSYPNKPIKTGPVGPQNKDLAIQAALAYDGKNYAAAAKLYSKLVDQSLHKNNWFAAASYLLSETECHKHLKDWKTAEHCIRRSIDMLVKAKCTNPLIRGQHLGLLASCLLEQSKTMEAESVGKQAILELSTSSQISDFYLVDQETKLATSLVGQGKYKENEVALHNAITHFRRLPLSQRRLLANPYIFLATYLNSEGRKTEAESVSMDGLKFGNEVGFESLEQRVQLDCQLAISLIGQESKISRMNICIKEALALCDREEIDTNLYLDLCHSWADAVLAVDKFQLAKDAIQKGIDLARKRDLADINFAVLLRDKARYEMATGNLDAALSCITEASEICAKKNASPICTMNVMSTLSTVYHKQENWHSELSTLNQLYKIQNDYFSDPEHSEIVNTMHRLALVLFKIGKFDEADRYFQKTLEIREKKKGVDDLSLAESLQEIGTTYCVTGKYNQSVPYFIRAIAIRDLHGDLSKGKYGLEGCLEELCYCYIAMKEPEKARGVAERLFELQSNGKGASEGVDAVNTLFFLAGSFIETQQIEEGNKLLQRVSQLRKTEKWKERVDKKIDLTEMLKNDLLLYMPK
ncbi:MAG: tetratricopeptide repeat protein [Candidatus Obscuribacterales bacterium]|jgi:tetratricopeptide (TPR) repeat protein|nr:tetratricopeptide repeat protein [Candidatus Obscuribacterales bacterium]